jgi:hypothetical protein
MKGNSLPIPTVFRTRKIKQNNSPCGPFIFKNSHRDTFALLYNPKEIRSATFDPKL